MSILQKVLEGHLPVRSYSGRGMYGKECLGVDGDLGQFLSALVEGTCDLEHSEVRELAEEVSCVRTDSMGMGMIVYFPKVPYVDEDSDGPESEEDDSDDD